MDEKKNTPKPPEIRRFGARTIILSAALAVILSVGVGALNRYVFGLRDLVLRDAPGTVPAGEALDSSPEEPLGVPNGGTGPRRSLDLISLAGFCGTPEYFAAQEWKRFQDGYDTDHEILNRIGNGPTGLDSRYDAYFVYTREMADALDAIAEKYGLALHEYTEQDWFTMEELFDAAGGPFLAENTPVYGGYLFRDGTFQCDGAGVLPGYGELDYQLRRTMKGVLDEVGLNIRDAEEYEQWNYQTACGETVLLALGPAKALILADLPNSFVAVNVLAGASYGLTAENLEALADGIDFEVLGR